MATPTRMLTVWFGSQQVGSLAEAGAVWRFDYAPGWTSFDLSPALPRSAGSHVDGGSQRPVQWFFDNLLPEEGARTLLAQDAGIEAADAFGLLAYYGAESAGALTLLPPGGALSEGGLKPLPAAELSQRIRALPRHALTQGAPKRMSMAGAQHKLAVVLRDGELFEPVGATPSTVVLKPDHVDVERYPHTVANEWFCMRVAQAAGLSVPPVSLRYVPEPVYLVDRFDRTGAWPDVRRRHALDACQLLSLDRAFKYQQCTVQTLVRLVGLCRRKALTRQRLFHWAVFNALIGNGDAHLKNLSFLVDEAGVELAPHYDLVSTASYAAPGAWGADELSLPMGGARRFGELRRADVLDFGAELGLPAAVAGRLLDELMQEVFDAATREAEVLNSDAAVVRDAGELRQLRVIVHGVLRDMHQQLD